MKILVKCLVLCMMLSLTVLSCRLPNTCCDPTPSPVPAPAPVTTIIDTVKVNDTLSTLVYTLILKPGAANGMDSYILTNAGVPASANANYATGPYMLIEAWTASGDQLNSKGLIDFDLSFLPAGAKIAKATMVLYADTITNYYGAAPILPGHSNLSGPNNWEIRRITSAWNESTVNWNNQPTTDNTTVLSMAASTSRTQTYKVDVTQFVKSEYANPALYYGFMFNLVNTTPYRSIIFCSSDNTNATLYPELKITYTL